VLEIDSTSKVRGHSTEKEDDLPQFFSYPLKQRLARTSRGLYISFYITSCLCTAFFAELLERRYAAFTFSIPFTFVTKASL